MFTVKDQMQEREFNDYQKHEKEVRQLKEKIQKLENSLERAEEANTALIDAIKRFEQKYIEVIENDRI